MTVQAISRSDRGLFAGLSSDTKPTTDIGLMARFFETDTQDWYIFDGSSWTVDIGEPVRQGNVAGGDISNNVQVVEQGQFDYETVAASQSDQVLGSTGAAGDLLHKLVCIVTTAATAQVQIKDGSGSAITVFPNSPGGGVGTYVLEFNISSGAGAWKVTTGAGVAVLAIGRFSA